MAEKHPLLKKFIHTPQFRIKDSLQVIVGATILAVPVSFTEETWRLGMQLPWSNIIGILALSVLFISLFTYHTYYLDSLHEHRAEFLKRVVWTYFLSFVLVALLLTLIEQASWTLDSVTAVKRAIIVTLPASLSGTVADTLH